MTPGRMVCLWQPCDRQVKAHNLYFSEGSVEEKKPEMMSVTSDPLLYSSSTAWKAEHSWEGGRPLKARLWVGREGDIGGDRW